MIAPDRLGVGNVGVGDELTVDDDLDVRANGDDFFIVPFADGLEGAAFRRDDAVDGAVILGVLESMIWSSMP